MSRAGAAAAVVDGSLIVAGGGQFRHASCSRLRSRPASPITTAPASDVRIQEGRDSFRLLNRKTNDLAPKRCDDLDLTSSAGICSYGNHNHDAVPVASGHDAGPNPPARAGAAKRRRQISQARACWARTTVAIAADARGPQADSRSDVLRSTIVRRRFEGTLRVQFLTIPKSKPWGSSTSGNDEKVRGFVPDR
jgi:hypothetical protein